MKMNFKKLQNLIRSPSGNLLFMLSSVLLLTIIVLAIVSVLFSQNGASKSVATNKKQTLEMISTLSTSRSKREISSDVKESQSTTNQEVGQTTSQSQPQSSDELSETSTNRNEIVQPQPLQKDLTDIENVNKQAQREAEIKQEEENQKEAERLKAEYEEKGYTVNFVYQEGN